jgi:NAD(P)-dependent dehydrogenase (short-subunit alcohol dehydrogenase family)
VVIDGALPLNGKVVVVTGGKKGIGAAIVAVAQSQGSQVVSFDIDTAPNPSDMNETGGLKAPLYLNVDVTSEAAVSVAAAHVVERFGRIDGLVNNAGRNSFGDATTMSESEWDAFMALDLKAAWLCAKVILPSLVDNAPSAIVNISSLHSLMTAEGFFPYAVAKTGLVGLTKSLALDFGGRGVRVNAVSPGYVDTSLAQDYFSERPGELERVLSNHPLGRIGTPREIAEVVCFLLSSKAGFVTGANWVVDGGLGSRFA